jgi:hypothetical protein
MSIEFELTEDEELLAIAEGTRRAAQPTGLSWKTTSHLDSGMGAEVALTAQELRFAAMTGALWAVDDPELSWKTRNQMSWGWFIEQAGAELAVAKFTGRRVDHERAGEQRVGPWIVSCSCEVFTGTADDEVVICVVGEAPIYILAGWVYAREVKRPERWNDRWWIHSYWVGKEDLHSMDALPDLPGVRAH